MRTFRFVGLAVVGLMTACSGDPVNAPNPEPAAVAQFTRVPEVPASNVFSLFANGDTIVAGTSNRTYVSTDAGATWQPSSQPAPGVVAITAVRIRNHRLFAGTAGQGVVISDDLGATWQAFNQGLVGGVANSQLDLSGFQVRGDSLYAATLGAGVYVRTLVGAGAWSHFGEEFEPNQASNVRTLALGGTRLLAGAGSNGEVFRRNSGDGEWTISSLDNVGLQPGLAASSAAFTGSGWVVGTNIGIFRSVAGQEPWTFVNLGLGTLNHSAFATLGRRLFAAFDIVNAAVIEISDDNGATWQILEVQPNVFVFELTMSGTTLYAGRADGLWRRSATTVSVPGDGGPLHLLFALAGSQPALDLVRLRFDLPAAASASIEVFDAAGRRAAERVKGTWSAGTHEVSLNARDVSAGVYFARLTTGGKLGPANGGTAGEQPAGRREIGWDAAATDPFNNRNDFPADFFNTNVTVGAGDTTGGTGLRNDSTLFSEINRTYAAELNSFSPTKIFSPIGSGLQVGSRRARADAATLPTRGS